MRHVSVRPSVHHAEPAPYALPALGQRLKTVAAALTALCLAASVAIVGLTLGFIAATLVLVGLLAGGGAWLTIRTAVRRRP
jgi:hypothetical protein